MTWIRITHTLVKCPYCGAVQCRGYKCKDCKRGDGMSYIVPRNKPDRCTNCLFIDKITYDCKLMYGNDYPDFESQYANCPLIELPPHGDLVDLNDMVHPNDSMRRMTIDEQLRRTCEGWSADRKRYVVIEAEGET